MSRYTIALVLVSLLASAGAEEKASEPVRLRMRLHRGQRFTGSNTVSYNLTTVVRQGDREKKTSKSVEHTERFVDTVLRSSTGGALEIERNYLKLFMKSRAGDNARPDVYQSPLQGGTVHLKERRRRREVRVDGRNLAGDQLVRRTAGMELDWRDVMPEDPVKPGDAWDADSIALSKRLAAYLNTGARPKMRVRFEELVVEEGRRLAKLYVDWTIEGMRDRNLFTKVSLAGDLVVDLDLERVVGIDLAGNIAVRGAIVGKGAPKIVRGEGRVSLKGSVKAADVQASADDDE